MTWRERAIVQSKSVDRSRARSLATIEGIIAGARALVIEREGGPFTTQELVERSGASLQTIYRYFPSKDALLLAVFEETIGEGTMSIRAAVERHDDPVEQFRALINASIPEHPPAGFAMNATVLVSVHTRLALLFPEQVEDTQRGYVDLVLGVIQAMVDTGRIAPRGAIDEDARLITYLVRATYQALITSRRGDSRTAAADHVTDFCLAALGRPIDNDVEPRPRSRPRKEHR